jgi:hypothetical protein
VNLGLPSQNVKPHAYLIGNNFVEFGALAGRMNLLAKARAWVGFGYSVSSCKTQRRNRYVLTMTKGSKSQLFIAVHKFDYYRRLVPATQNSWVQDTTLHCAMLGVVFAISKCLYLDWFSVWPTLNLASIPQH